jgi:hypothetical protein
VRGSGERASESGEACAGKCLHWLTGRKSPVASLRTCSKRTWPPRSAGIRRWCRGRSPGTAGSGHTALTLATDISRYISRTRIPRGSGDENTNGIVREYFPKGTEINGYIHYLQAVADEINDRPVLSSDSGRQQKRSQNFSLPIIPGITSAQLLAPVEGIHGQRRRHTCGLPAGVDTGTSSTPPDGPLENTKIRCARGHLFNGPTECLTCQSGRPRALYQPARRHLRQFKGQYRICRGDKSSECRGDQHEHAAGHGCGAHSQEQRDQASVPGRRLGGGRSSAGR